MAEVDNYRIYRSVMDTMDGLQFYGDYANSAVIRKVSGQDVNHTAAVLRMPRYDRERVYTTEALQYGLFPYPLSNRLADYKGKIWWHQLKEEYKGEPQRLAMQWLMRHWGTPYDYPGCASHWRTLFGIDPRKADASALWCTEAYFLAWRDGAKLPHLQGMKFAPMPGRPMEKLGLWLPRRLIQSTI
jgi:hypothetical protein